MHFPHPAPPHPSTIPHLHPVSESLHLFLRHFNNALFFPVFQAGKGPDCTLVRYTRQMDPQLRAHDSVPLEGTL